MLKGKAARHTSSNQADEHRPRGDEAGQRLPGGLTETGRPRTSLDRTGRHRESKAFLGLFALDLCPTPGGHPTLRGAQGPSPKAVQLLIPNPWGRNRYTQALGRGSGKARPTASGKVAVPSAPWSLTWARGNPARRWGVLARAPEGEAKARRLLPTAACQAAMARCGQATGGRPPGSPAKSQSAASSPWQRRQQEQSGCERCQLEDGDAGGESGLEEDLRFGGPLLIYGEDVLLKASSPPWLLPPSAQKLEQQLEGHPHTPTGTVPRPGGGNIPLI